jgi:hypothetical protein
MWWQKNIIHLNNNSMVKDLVFKHGSDNWWQVQIFTFVT